MDAQTSEEGRLSLWQQLVSIATGLSVIVGVLISVQQLAGWVGDSKQANVAARLESLGQVKEFLAADEQVRRRGRAFVKDRLPQLMPRIEQLIREAGNGEDVYLSKDLEDFAAVHYHYEQLGALVKLGYIEFPLIFEIIAFPDDYMKQVQPLREALAANWKGMGKPLPDLGGNIDYLKSCYTLSRERSKDRPTCSAP
jgi:hypothetical protein